MALLNFQSRFADAVESGAKHQTIRAQRKYAIKAGDTLYLYTGCRTKQARRLRVCVCERTTPTVIQADKITLGTTHGVVFIYGGNLTAFAQADGFGSWAEMRDWFDRVHGLPFTGVLIEWSQADTGERVTTSRRAIRRKRTGGNDGNM
jgi:hypothetical protein